MDADKLAALVQRCRLLIDERFPTPGDHGGAVMMLDNGQMVEGTAPEAANPSVEVCHEIEPYCAAFRLDRRILATVCLHRTPDRKFLVLSPCGVCRERLATHGPQVLVAVADRTDPSVPRWISLTEALPHYWATALPNRTDTAWT